MYSELANLFTIASDKIEGRQVYKCEKYLRKTQWLRKADLQKMQYRKLKKLLIHAFENVPHYHESFKKANFRPRDFNSLNDTYKIPILRKQTIRSELATMLTKNSSKKRLLSWHTSGTTAFPMKFYRDKADLSWAVGAELRGYSWAGYKTGDKLALVWAYSLDHGRHFKIKLKEYLKRIRLLNVTGLSDKSMAKFAKMMHRFRPRFVRGYAYAINLFATFLLQNAKYKIKPRAVFTCASTLFPHYRKTIEKAFNCKVYDYYSTNEVSFVAAQCGEHEGLHISEENIYLEVVDDCKRPVDAGEEGQVLVTNLHSYAMPFIRYEVGDSGRIFPDECSCGRQHSLMKPIGRTYESFVNSDGSFTNLRDFETVFEEVPISEFQVIQESYDEIVVKIVAGPGYSDAHTEFIEKNIKLRGSAIIRVELVDSIQPEKPGKPRHIVSKIPTKYT